MVIFVTNISAYFEMESLILTGNYPVWLSDGVLDQDKIDELLTQDIDLTVLSYSVDTSNSKDMDCAMSTIKEHHFGQNIWVQINNEN